MPVDIRDAVYSGISQQFPAIYQEDGDFLVSFVQAYYEHLDEKNDRNIPKLRDIDTTLSTFLIYYKKKFLADLPIDTKLDVRYIIKHIQDMYRRKGTQESLELLFRMFFDEDIEVFYPSTSILRPSDSIWGGDAYLEMRPVFTVDEYPVEKGMRIRGDVSLASAFVDEVIFVNFDGALVPIVYLSNIAGSFSSDDGIQVVTTQTDGTETVSNVGRLIKGSMSAVEVKIQGVNRLPDQAVGDKVKLLSRSVGVEAEGRVTEISSTTTGVIDFQIIDGGFGYVDPSTTTLTVKNDIGVSNQVMVLSGDAQDIKRGDVVIANGDLITYTQTGGLSAIKYTLTGSAKVIEYNHPLIFLYSDDFDTVSTFLNQVASPVGGPNAGSAPTNIFIESMRNAAYSAYNDAAPSLTVTPAFMPSEHRYIWKALQKKNQALSTQPTGNADIDNLGFLFNSDSDPSTADDYAEITVSTLGTGSRQILQEYLNVMNLTGKFPVFSGSIYDNDDISTAERDQWRSFFEGALLALAKVGYYPQMTMGRPKVGTVELPNVQTSITAGQKYMIYDNNKSTLFSSYHAGSESHEGFIFTANQTLDFSLSTSTDKLAVVSATASDGFPSYTDTELTNFHLNRLRFDSPAINTASNTPSKRIRDKSGVAIDYPSLISPSFSFRRYRGDLARYDSSVASGELESKVFLDSIPLQSFGVRNNTAEFEIGSLTNVETVTVIPDLIGDFASTQLDIGADGVIEGDDYGMSGPGAENLNTRIVDSFSPITLKIGTIDSLNVLNSGVDYQNDVAVVIENSSITKFDRKDTVLNFETVDFDLSVGDVITQNIQIPDLQINQAGNRLHEDAGNGQIFLETLASSTVGSNYENSATTFDFSTGATKQYEVKAKFLKREGNDFYFRPLSFYGFEGNIGITNMNPNQEYAIVSTGNLSSADWQTLGALSGIENEVFTSADEATLLANISASDIGTVSIPVNIGSKKKNISRIFEDQNSQPMGANAEISGTALYQTGQVDGVAVTKTGYRYEDLEVVDIVNNEPNSANYNKTIGQANVRVLGQGKTGGKWSSKTSFLSESSKSLHDNNFFQEYSYEISSIVNPDKYEPLIKETVGVAGTKLFSKPLVNSINAMGNDLNLEIATFNITGVPISTINVKGVNAIESGVSYKIHSLGNTTATQWGTLGVDLQTATFKGLSNLQANDILTIEDIGSAGWSTVQFRNPDERTAWYTWWVYVTNSLFLDPDDNDPADILPTFGYSGRTASLIQALRMVNGSQPMTDELQQRLDLITNGFVFQYVPQAVGFGDLESSIPYTDLNEIEFTKQSVEIGAEFTASVNGLDNGGSNFGTGQVEFKEAIIVSPHYTGDAYQPHDYIIHDYTTSADGSSVTQLATTANNLIDGRYYIVHSIQPREEMTPAITGTLNTVASMDMKEMDALGSNSTTLVKIASAWNNVLRSGDETVVMAVDESTWPRRGTIFKGEPIVTGGTPLDIKLGEVGLAEITDSLTEVSASDISGNTVTISAHGFEEDTLLQYHQYKGTSSGNLEGQPHTNRRDEYEYYYAVNVTTDTFQLSKTPKGTTEGEDTSVPIDLSTVAGGPHLFVRQTAILADDAVLIGIQEQ
jgi:hypothetical protein